VHVEFFFGEIFRKETTGKIEKEVEGQ